METITSGTCWCVLVLCEQFSPVAWKRLHIDLHCSCVQSFSVNVSGAARIPAFGTVQDCVACSLTCKGAAVVALWQLLSPTIYFLVDLCSRRTLQQAPQNSLRLRSSTKHCDYWLKHKLPELVSDAQGLPHTAAKTNSVEAYIYALLILAGRLHLASSWQ